MCIRKFDGFRVKMKILMEPDFDTFEGIVRACRICAGQMQRSPNPILQIHPDARVLIASQAPGNRADVSGIPFNDPSGDRLRDWMGVERDVFYDRRKIAIVPMGFCFPGYDQYGGDLPPMKICATHWRESVLARLPDIQLQLLVGGYSQKWHLPDARKKSLTATVRDWKKYRSERILTLPHPSWRNTAWLKKNPWFEEEVLPALRSDVRDALS